MNKTELRYLINKGLAREAGDSYGHISGVELTDPCPADPEVGMIVRAPDPFGATRTYRIVITEVEEDEG